MNKKILANIFFLIAVGSQSVNAQNADTTPQSSSLISKNITFKKRVEIACPDLVIIEHGAASRCYENRYFSRTEYYEDVIAGTEPNEPGAAVPIAEVPCDDLHTVKDGLDSELAAMVAASARHCGKRAPSEIDQSHQINDGTEIIFEAETLPLETVDKYGSN